MYDVILASAWILRLTLLHNSSTCFKAKFTIYLYYQCFFAFTVLCNVDNTKTSKACVTHTSHVGYVRPVKRAIKLRAYVTGKVIG